MIASNHIRGHWWDRPETILWILTQEEFVVESKEVIGILHDFATYFARDCYRNPFTPRSPEWARILLRLLQDGVNLSGFDQYQRTPLDMLLACDECQFSSQYVGM